MHVCLQLSPEVHLSCFIREKLSFKPRLRISETVLSDNILKARGAVTRLESEAERLSLHCHPEPPEPRNRGAIARRRTVEGPPVCQPGWAEESSTTTTRPG